MISINFFIPGKPATQGSKRAFWRPGMKYAGLKDDCERNLPWRSDVKDAALKAIQNQGQGFPDLSKHTGPVEMQIKFYLSRPVAHFGSGKNSEILKPNAPQAPTKKPDLTKLIRPVEDALKGLFWKDDSQIVATFSQKIYADEDHPEGCLVTLLMTEASYDTDE